MGKNKNKRNKQNSAGWNKDNSRPFNNKIEQDKPINKGNNQGMNKDKAFDDFGKRLKNEQSAFSMKKDLIQDKNENAGHSNNQKQQRQKENKTRNDGLSAVHVPISQLKQQIKNSGQKNNLNLSATSTKDKESPKETTPSKKKVKFETSSDSSNETLELNEINKKRFGSPRETPPTKRVKLDSSSTSFDKHNELNSKKDINLKNNVKVVDKNDLKSKDAVKSKSLAKFDINGSIDDSDMEDESDLEDEDGGESLDHKNDLKSKDAVKSKNLVKLDLNGSINDSDMEDESDLEDEDGESLGLDDSENDDEENSLMDEEDDSLIFDEEEDEDESLVDSSTELVDLKITGYNISKNTDNCVILKAQKDYSIAAIPFKLHKFSENGEHSVHIGLKALQWILSPIGTDQFFSDIFQKRVLVLKRATNAYFDGFFNTDDFINLIKNNHVLYGKDVNVASYVAGVRYNHNPLLKDMQRVTLANAFQHFRNGRSLQCVHPQVFNDKVWYICDALQEVFCSFVGANNYLTPAGSAGFAPHFDDIDAFMLQIEGRKHWKIYAPKSMDDTLPLESSGNFNDSDFDDREPIFDGWLDQGDLIYVPRGFVHQANTGPEKHSHHVTISVCRKFSYAEFFEQASTEFIQMITSKSKHLRSALPPHLLDMGGAVSLNYPNEESFSNRLLPIAKIFSKKFATDFSRYIPSYIDLISKEFFLTALPPFLSNQEIKQTCLGYCDDFFDKEKSIVIGAETEVRFVRMHGQRLIFEEDDSAYIIHRMNNSRRFEENVDESTFDFPLELQDGFITLCDTYPKWKTVQSLGCNTLEKNIELTTLLFNNCILLMRQKEKK